MSEAENIIRINILELISHVHTLSHSFLCLLSCAAEADSGRTCTAAPLSPFIAGLLLPASWRQVTVSHWGLWRGQEWSHIAAGVVTAISIPPFTAHKHQKVPSIPGTLLLRATLHKHSHAVGIISSMWSSSWQQLPFWPLRNHIPVSELHCWPRLGP